MFGPTGVGKTTLRLKIEQLIAQELLSELKKDLTQIPVLSVEAVAPESGSFNWRDHFKRLLYQLDEPLVDRKLNRPLEANVAAATRQFMPTPRAVGTEYRYAVEQAIRYRRPAAVMIDEAQHIGKISSGRRLLDQLDVIKSFANQTKTVHILLGTYDLLAFRNLNGQLSRRSIDVHLARYRAEDSEDRQTFINVVQSFEKQLPFDEPSDLVSNWEFLYERSLGCIGILKEWIVRAVTVAYLRASAAVQASGCRPVMSLDKSMRMQRIFDAWSLSPVPIPPRSLLYGIEPINIGMALVESLTSYVGRLAAAHSLKVGDLAGRVLSQASIPRTRSSRRKPEPPCAVAMDLKFPAIRSMVSPTERENGSRLLSTQPVVATCVISLSSRFAMPYLTICFIGTGLGARSVSSNGG